MSYGFRFLNGSFVLNNNGHIDTVESTEKVKKDVYKMFITNLNNRFGTEMRTLVGTTLSRKAVELNLQQYIKQSVYNFVQIQKENPFLTDDETIENASLNVWLDLEDMNQINWEVELLLKSGVIIDDLPTQTLKIGV